MTATPPAGTTATSGSVAARLDRLPLSRWHRRMTLLIGIGSFFNFFEIALGSLLAVLLKDPWHLGTAQQAAIIGSAFAGEFFGSLLLAPLADRYGRRTMFQVNLLTYSLLSLACAAAPGLSVLLVLRFAAGIGLGAELTLVDTYLTELLPSAHRGRYIARSYTFGMLALPIAGAVTSVAAHALSPSTGWRLLLALSAAGGLLVWTLRRRLPESPRWLSALGRTDQAESVLAGIETQVAAATGAPLPAPIETVADSPPHASEQTGSHRRRTVLVWAIQTLGPISFYAFSSLVPLVLLTKGFDIVHSVGYTALTALGYPAGSLISIPLVERFERRSLLISAAATVAASGIVFGYAGATWLIVTAGMATTMANVVLSNTIHIYQAELFPTRIRSTALGRPYAMSRITSAVLPFGGLTILHALGATGLYTTSAALLISMIIAVRVLGPLTNNRTLESV